MSMSLDALTTLALRTALHDRVTDRVSGPEVVAAVLNQRVDLDFLDGSGDTPLYCAAFFRRPEIVELLIMRGAKIDHGRESPLFAAAFQNDTEIARLLLQNKAQVNARDYYRNTALHIITDADLTVQWDRTDIARLLLENKADYTLRNSLRKIPMELEMSDSVRKLIEEQIAKDSIDTKDTQNESERESETQKEKLKP